MTTLFCAAASLFINNQVKLREINVVLAAVAPNGSGARTTNSMDAAGPTWIKLNRDRDSRFDF
jgi:hypothetical protein